MPAMAPLIPAVPVTDELLAMAAPVSPGEVFRFAAGCVKGGCRHWEDDTQRCRLVAKTVQLAPVVMEKLKPAPSVPCAAGGSRRVRPHACAVRKSHRAIRPAVG
jgi:hypothetical protein